MWRKGRRNPAVRLQAHPWARAGTFEVAHRLNSRCLEWLAGSAAAVGDSGASEIAIRYRHLWGQMGVLARQRAARTPIVLFDLQFGSTDWWRRAIEADFSSVRRGDGTLGYALKQAVPLVREVLIEARTLMVAEPRAALLIFGTTPAAASLIAALTSDDIDRIAAHHARNLRPRWEDSHVFWENLLLAALGEDDAVLADAHLHSLQLLGSEFLPCR